MVLPSEFSASSEKVLHELSFELIESSENSWNKLFVWTNDIMKFVLEYDRLYYNCYILPHPKPIEKLYLIKLLRFLKNDGNFYSGELVAANLSYTLPINEYVKLFHENYDLVKESLVGFNSEKFENYDKYITYYNGI